MREKFLKLRELPRCKNPTIDIAFPIVTFPRIDMLLPAQHAFLSDIDDPNKAKLNTLTAEPNLAKLRRDRELPNSTASTTERDWMDPMRIRPAIDTAEPTRHTVLIDTVDPIVT
jgi:hypothetical protein